jgi:hypothetical protein
MFSLSFSHVIEVMIKTQDKIWKMTAIVITSSDKNSFLFLMKTQRLLGKTVNSECKCHYTLNRHRGCYMHSNIKFVDRGATYLASKNQTRTSNKFQMHAADT